MNRRSFLRGVAATAVAIPLAPLLPKALPPVHRVIGDAEAALAMSFDKAIYRPKYLYGRALMYDWSGGYLHENILNHRMHVAEYTKMSRAIDAGAKWLDVEAVA